MKSTAVVTGASSGLGAEFARQLAAKGFDLIIAARRRERLECLARELEQKHGVAVQVFAVDLTKPDVLEELARLIQSRSDVEILVNNAGYGAGGRYDQADTERQMGMIALHVTAAARLTRAALPQMVARGRGAVINMASVVAFAHLPGSTLYCTTKKWLVDFSRSIADELAGTGVHIQALCPGFTRTEAMEGKKLPEFLWLTCEEVVAASLRAAERGSGVCVPSFTYKLLVFILRSPLGGLLSWARMARKRRKARM
ncbi:SDR family oxidoreductase [bacterium]|nr:SDR family oxidoreductase [bacterium]